MLKSYQEKKNANNEEDPSGIHLSRVYCLPLSSLPGATPGNVRWCPSLTLGSLFETTCLRKSQSVPVSFRLHWFPLFFPTSFPSAQGPGVVHLKSESTASTTSTCLQRGLWCDQEGGIPGSPPGGAIQFSGEMVGMFPCHPTTPLCLSQIISNNV